MVKLTPETFWSFLLYSGVSPSSVFVSLSILATISFTMRFWLAFNWVVVIVGGSLFGISSFCMFALASTRLTQYSYVSFVSIERSVSMIAFTGIIVVRVAVVDVSFMAGGVLLLDPTMYRQSISLGSLLVFVLCSLLRP